MARDNDDGGGGGGGSPSMTPDSPTSAGFSTDQLPLNTSRTSENFSTDDEAAVDPDIIRDEPEEADEEEEGEDLFNDNFMESVLDILLLRPILPFSFDLFYRQFVFCAIVGL